jgi:HlyD family secretion protein
MSAIVDTAVALVPAGPAPRLSLPPSGAGFPGLPGIPLHPLLDAPAPRTRAPMLAGLGTFLVFVAGFGAWATLAPLAEASVAPGLVKVEGSRRTIQHLEGGAVREILFRDGAQVKAGEVIARLDVVQADSQLETQRAQRWALLAQDA